MSTIPKLHSFELEETIDKLNELEASICVTRIKVSGFTSNLITPSFYEYHSFLNLLVEWLEKASYDLKERVKALNGTANYSMAVIKHLSFIKDEVTAITDPPKIVDALYDDFVTLSDHSREIFKMSGEVADAGTIGLMTQIAFKAEHFAWELNKMKGK